MTQEVDNVDELEAMLAELEMESQLAAEAEPEPVVIPAAQVVRAAPVIDDDATDVDLAAELVAGLAAAEMEIDPPFVPVIPPPKPVRRNKPRPLVIEDEKPAETALGSDLSDEELADLELDDLEPAAQSAPTPTPVVEDADVEAALNSLETAPVVQQPKKTAKGPSPRQRMEALLAAQEAELAAAAAAASDEPEPASGTPEDKEDAELAELLKDVEDTAPVATSKPTPTAGSGGGSAKTIRPTFNPSGDLKTFIDPDQLQDDLNFTTTNISLAMTRQASLFAHYSNLAAQATYQSDRAKQQVELHEASLDQRFRDSLVTAGTKFTETSLRALIVQDTTYQAAQIRAHEARAIAKMVDTAADSFRHRKDMLIQVGADLRQEKQGDLRMKEKEHPGSSAVRHMEGN